VLFRSVLAIKNQARSDWNSLNSPYPTYTIRPPKPTSWSMSPSTLYLPGGRTLLIDNSQNQTVTLDYRYPNLPDVIYEFPLVMNSSAYWSDPGYVPCGFEPVGTYTFKRIRNQLDSGADAWTTLTNKTQLFVQCP
jgi:hypothetical protein